MQKEMKKNVFRVILLCMFLAVAFMFSACGESNNVALLSGKEDPYDTGVYIGFKESRDYVAEENNGVFSVDVFLSQAQDHDVAFTLSSNKIVERDDYPGGPRYDETWTDEDNQEMFAWMDAERNAMPLINIPSGGTIKAGEKSVTIQVKQPADSVSYNGVRRYSIYIVPITEGITQYDATGVYNYNLTMQIYNIDGEAGLIIKNLMSSSQTSAALLEKTVYENQGYFDISLIRTGALPENCDDIGFYFSILGANAEWETQISASDYVENSNSYFAFDNTNAEFNREQKLRIYLIDNSDIDWHKRMNVIFFNYSGFDGLGDRDFNFTINDDELANLLPNRYLYFQARDGELNEGYDYYGNNLYLALYDPTTDRPNATAHSVEYSIDFSGTTARYGIDYTIEGFDEVNNKGTLEFSADSGEAYIHFETPRNREITNDLIVKIKYQVAGSVLPANNKDYSIITIRDTDRVPNGEGVTFLKGSEESVYVNESYNTVEFVYIALPYTGIPTSVLVEVEEESAQLGKDFVMINGSSQQVTFDGENLLRIEFRTLRTEFYGVRTFKLKIAEQSLPSGIILGEYPEMQIRIIGQYKSESKFTYSINQYGSIGVNKEIELTRYEYGELTQYIDFADGGTILEGVHYDGSLYPLKIEWADWELTKTIILPLLEVPSLVNGATGSVSGELVLLNANLERYEWGNDLWANTVPLTLDRVYSGGELFIESSTNISFDMTRGDEQNFGVRRDITYYSASVDYVISTDGIDEEEKADLSYIAQTSGTIYFEAGEIRAYIPIRILSKSALLGKKIKLTLLNPSYNAKITPTYSDFYGNPDIFITFDTERAGAIGSAFTYSTSSGTGVMAYLDLKAGRETSWETLSITPKSSFGGMAITTLRLYAHSNFENDGLSVWYNGNRILPTPATSQDKQNYMNKYTYDGMALYIPYFAIRMDCYYEIELQFDGNQTKNIEFRFNKTGWWWSEMGKNFFFFLPYITGDIEDTGIMPQEIFSKEWSEIVPPDNAVYADTGTIYISDGLRKTFHLYRTGDLSTRQEVVLDQSDLDGFAQIMGNLVFEVGQREITMTAWPLKTSLPSKEARTFSFKLLNAPDSERCYVTISMREIFYELYDEDYNVVSMDDIYEGSTYILRFYTNVNDNTMTSETANSPNVPTSVKVFQQGSGNNFYSYVNYAYYPTPWDRGELLFGEQVYNEFRFEIQDDRVYSNGSDSRLFHFYYTAGAEPILFRVKDAATHDYLYSELTLDEFSYTSDGGVLTIKRSNPGLLGNWYDLDFAGLQNTNKLVWTNGNPFSEQIFVDGAEISFPFTIKDKNANVEIIEFSLLGQTYKFFAKDNIAAAFIDFERIGAAPNATLYDDNLSSNLLANFTTEKAKIFALLRLTAEEQAYEWHYSCGNNDILVVGIRPGGSAVYYYLKVLPNGEYSLVEANNGTVRFDGENYTVVGATQKGGTINVYAKNTNGTIYQFAAQIVPNKVSLSTTASSAVKEGDIITVDISKVGYIATTLKIVLESNRISSQNKTFTVYMEAGTTTSTLDIRIPRDYWITESGHIVKIYILSSSGTAIEGDFITLDVINDITLEGEIQFSDYLGAVSNNGYVYGDYIEVTAVPKIFEFGKTSSQCVVKTYLYIWGSFREFNGRHDGLISYGSDYIRIKIVYSICGNSVKEEIFYFRYKELSLAVNPTISHGSQGEIANMSFIVGDKMFIELPNLFDGAKITVDITTTRGTDTYVLPAFSLEVSGLSGLPKGSYIHIDIIYEFSNTIIASFSCDKKYFPTPDLNDFAVSADTFVRYNANNLSSPFLVSIDMKAHLDSYLELEVQYTTVYITISGSFTSRTYEIQKQNGSAKIKFDIDLVGSNLIGSNQTISITFSVSEFLISKTITKNFFVGSSQNILFVAYNEDTKQPMAGVDVEITGVGFNFQYKGQTQNVYVDATVGWVIGVNVVLLSNRSYTVVFNKGRRDVKYAEISRTFYVDNCNDGIYVELPYTLDGRRSMYDLSVSTMTPAQFNALFAKVYNQMGVLPDRTKDSWSQWFLGYSVPSNTVSISKTDFVNQTGLFSAYDANSTAYKYAVAAYWQLALESVSPTSLITINLGIFWDYQNIQDKHLEGQRVFLALGVSTEHVFAIVDLMLKEIEQYSQEVYRLTGDSFNYSNYPDVEKMLEAPAYGSLFIVSFKNYGINAGKDNIRFSLSGARKDKIRSGGYDMRSADGRYITAYRITAGLENSRLGIYVEDDWWNVETNKHIPLVAFGNAYGSEFSEELNEIISGATSIEVPADQVELLGGMDMAYNISRVPLNVQYDEKTGQLAVYMGGMVRNSLAVPSNVVNYYSVPRPEAEDLWGDDVAAVKPGGNFEWNVGFGGKMLFKYDKSIGAFRLEDGYFIFAAQASYSYTYYMLVPVVYVPVYFQAGIGMTTTFESILDWDEAEGITFEAEATVALNTWLEAGIGVPGLVSAGIKMYADASVAIQFPTGASKVEVTIGGGVNIKIFFWSKFYSFGSKTWTSKSNDYNDDLYKSAYASLLSEFKPGVQYAGIMVMTDSGGNIINRRTVTGAEAQTGQIFVSNIYSEAVPQIAELSDGTKLMAWINYDATRGINNAEVINYIYHDGTAWESNFRVLDTTNTADLNFDLKVINDNFVIAFIDVKNLGSGASMADRLTGSDVAWAVFNKTTKTFGAKQTLLSDNFNNRIVRIATDGTNAAMIVYSSRNPNINENMTVGEFLAGAGANNVLLISVYNNGVWSAFKEVKTTLPLIMEMSATIIDGMLEILIEGDLDAAGMAVTSGLTASNTLEGGLETLNDREIFRFSYDLELERGSLRRLTFDTVVDSAPLITVFNNRPLTVWLAGNEVHYEYNETIRKITGVILNTGATFSFTSNEQFMALLWTQADEQGNQQIYMSLMDASVEVFSKPFVVTTGSNIKRSPIGIFNGDGMDIYYCEDIYSDIDVLPESTGVVSQGLFTVTSNILQTHYTFTAKPKITDIYLDLTQISPNQIASALVYFDNEGILSANNYVLNLYNGDTLIKSFNLATVLQGGGNLYSEIRFLLPNGAFTLRAELVYDDDVVSVFEKILLQPDIGLNGYSIIKIGDEYKIIVNVFNNSGVEATNIKLIIGDYYSELDAYGTLTIDKIPANFKGTYYLTLPTSFVTEFNDYGKFYFSAYLLMGDGTFLNQAEYDYAPANNRMSIFIAESHVENPSLDIIGDEITIIIGEEEFFNLIYTGDGELTYSSSDESVVTVNENGLIGHKEGTAVITITDSTLTDTITIIVRVKPILTIDSDLEIVVAHRSDFENPTATVDVGDMEIYGQITVRGYINTEIIGQQIIIYEYVENGKIFASVTLRVTVEPNAPIYHLTDNSITGYAVGDSLVELYDNRTGNLVESTNSRFGAYTISDVGAGEYYLINIVNSISSPHTAHFTIGSPVYITTDGVVNNPVEVGASVTLIAPTRAGYNFVGWYLGDTLISTDIEYTFNASADMSLVTVYSVHNLTQVMAVVATCSADGNIEYWYCEDCDKYFTESTGTMEITQAQTIIAATGHDYGIWTVTTTPTSTTAGVLTRTCSYVSSHTETIALPILNTTDYTYSVVTAATTEAAGEGKYVWNEEAYGTFSFTVAIAKIPVYEVIEDNGGTAKIGDSGYTFKIDGDFDKFDKLEINGVVLIKDTDYTVSQGSTIITINKTGLAKIGEGNHTVKVYYTDGAVVTTSLTIDKAGNDGLGGGAVAAIIIVSILTLGIGGFAIFWFVVKKKKFADLINVFKKSKPQE